MVDVEQGALRAFEQQVVPPALLAAYSAADTSATIGLICFGSAIAWSKTVWKSTGSALRYWVSTKLW